MATLVVYGAGLVEVSPVVLVRQLLPTLLAGAAVTMATACSGA